MFIGTIAVVATSKGSALGGEGLRVLSGAEGLRRQWCIDSQPGPHDPEGSRGLVNLQCVIMTLRVCSPPQGEVGRHVTRGGYARSVCCVRRHTPQA